MLTVMAVKNAAPAAKDYKIADSGGLHLFITTRGHKSWRFKYRFGGKEKRLVFGAFPEMSLAQAREKRDEARRQIKDGKDPGLVAQRAKLIRSTPSAVTFERFARAWHEHEKDRWKPVHADDVITSLERDVFPALGAYDVADIDETMVIAVLSKVEKRGAIETAHRLRQRPGEQGAEAYYQRAGDGEAPLRRRQVEGRLRAVVARGQHAFWCLMQPLR